MQKFRCAGSTGPVEVATDWILLFLVLLLPLLLRRRRRRRTLL